MYSPHKFADRIGNIGTPLPDPYKAFGYAQARFRLGQVSMIAGKPGSFKSVLALNMLVNWARQGITSYYFCADSEEFTVIKRLSGILTGENLNLIERRIIAGDHARYHDVLQRELGDRVQFEYERMDWDSIVYHIASYEAVYGGHPGIIFIDNLIDFVSNPQAWDEMLQFIGNCDDLSKQIKSHVCILHHAKLGDGDKDKKGEARIPGTPPADHEIQGKLTQKARLTITIAAEDLSVKVAVVKNTLGPQDRNAQSPYSFTVYENMQMKDHYR